VDERALADLLERVASGEIPVGQAVEDLRELPYERVPGAKIDHHRELRTGQAEAVFAPGKTPEQVRDAAAAIAARATGAVFVTRATSDQFHAVLERLPAATYGHRSRLIVAKRAETERPLGDVVVLSAGTADLPVAEEALQTADALGLAASLVVDVGVAGLHRLLEKRSQIAEADCVIAVAGMEGALASVVAGLTPRPVIAVPTSVGYGAGFQGLAPLLTMLNSCAAGVAVMNIDNGFGAGVLAHRINLLGE
jgi:NCAIR mutase (PurE)-related protein